MTETRWTIVTGASSGLGAEMARIFGAKGSALVLVARREDRLAALAQEIQAAAGVPVRTLVLDLERPDSPDALAAWLAQDNVVVHTLVNNAGFGLRGRFATMPYAEQAAMVELNVAALTKLCRLILPDMIARRRGGILNVASTASFQAIPYMAVYAATKAYVLALSEALHEEARGHGVTVTAFCPGPTATEFTVRANLEKSKMFERAMGAAEAARIGVAGYEAGRAIVVAGGMNRVGAIVAQLAPRALTRRAAGWLQG